MSLRSSGLLAEEVTGAISRCCRSRRRSASALRRPSGVDLRLDVGTGCNAQVLDAAIIRQAMPPPSDTASTCSEWPNSGDSCSILANCSAWPSVSGPSSIWSSAVSIRFQISSRGSVSREPMKHMCSAAVAAMGRSLQHGWSDVSISRDLGGEEDHASGAEKPKRTSRARGQGSVAGPRRRTDDTTTPRSRRSRKRRACPGWSRNCSRDGWMGPTR